MIATCIVHFLVQQSAAAQGGENLSFTTTYTCAHGFDNVIYLSSVALTVVDTFFFKKKRHKKAVRTTIPAYYSAMHPALLHACAWQRKYARETTLSLLIWAYDF